MSKSALEGSAKKMQKACLDLMNAIKEHLIKELFDTELDVFTQLLTAAFLLSIVIEVIYLI